MTARRTSSLALLLTLSCTRGGEDSLSELPGEGTGFEQSNTVVVITIDTVRSRVLHGNGVGWDVAPTIHAFLDDAVWFEGARAPRGLTAVSLSSMLTGTYPRDHDVRNNDMGDLLSQPSLADRFGDQGYTTLGFAANQCVLLEHGFDESTCGALMNDGDTGTPKNQEDLDQVANDRLLVDSFRPRVMEAAPDEKLFVWVHLNLPHSPYYEISPWFEQFHPQEYAGDIDTSSESDLYMVTLGERSYDDADRSYVEAVYASEIRETDDVVAEFLDALRAADRYEDAIVVLGADHGEELGDHDDFFFHGCSPYDSVLRVDYALRAPGRLPLGVHVQAPISVVDIAPTLTQLSGVEWNGLEVGHSLATEILDGVDPSHEVFFERGTGTAGLVRGDIKYVLTPEGGFSDCSPYDNDPEIEYPAAIEELYDLSEDPDEAHDLATSEPTRREAMADTVCDWVRERAWVPSYRKETNPVLIWCSDNHPP